MSTDIPSTWVNEPCSPSTTDKACSPSQSTDEPCGKSTTDEACNPSQSTDEPCGTSTTDEAGSPSQLMDELFKACSPSRSRSPRRPAPDPAPDLVTLCLKRTPPPGTPIPCPSAPSWSPGRTTFFQRSPVSGTLRRYLGSSLVGQWVFGHPHWLCGSPQSCDQRGASGGCLQGLLG